MPRCCDNAVPGRPDMRNKDSPGEYSSQQGASPSVSEGNVDAVTKEASTHRRVPVVASEKERCPVVCKLMLRQATVASKRRNCCLTKRSIIARLQGSPLPHLTIQDRTGEVKKRSRRTSPFAKHRCSHFIPLHISTVYSMSILPPIRWWKQNRPSGRSVRIVPSGPSEEPRR